MKKKSASRLVSFDPRALACSGLSLLGAFVAFVAPGTYPNTSLLAQDAAQNPDMSAVYKARVGEHGTRGEPNLSGVEVGAIYSQGLEEVPPVATMAPTRSSFMATWDPVSGATGYRLDVSISSSFSSYVSGYQGLDVGNATNRIVSGLRPGTIYYYRVRAYNSLGASSGPILKTATTAATTSGLVINPTFDSSILNDPNAAAIQSMTLAGNSISNRSTASDTRARAACRCRSTRTPSTNQRLSLP